MEILPFIKKNYPCLFPLIPAIIGYTSFKVQDIAGKIITILSTFGFVIYCISAIGALNGNNMRSLHLWTVLEFSSISIFYYVIISNRKLKLLIGVISSLFLVFTIINSLFIQGIYTYNSHARGLEATLLTLFSLIYLIYIINNEDFFKESFLSIKYYVIAIIIYFGFSQFLYLTYNYLSVYHSFWSDIGYDILRKINLTFNLLLAVGLWKKKLKQT